MLKSTLFSKGAVGAAVAALTLAGAASLPNAAAAQDCSVNTTVGALAGGGLGAAAGSNLARGGGRTGGAIIGGVLGALAGSSVGHSTCAPPPPVGYAPPPQAYAPAPTYYSEAPPPAYAPAYAAPVYAAPPPATVYYEPGYAYAPAPAVVVGGPYWYHGRYWRHRWW